MEKSFKYIMLAFIGIVIIFIIFAMVWFSKNNLRTAVENLNKADTTLARVASDLKAAQNNLLDARNALKSLDSTLTDIRSKVDALDKSRIKNQKVFDEMNRTISGKVDEILSELNKVSGNLNDPVIHK